MRYHKTLFHPRHEGFVVIQCFYGRANMESFEELVHKATETLVPQGNYLSDTRALYAIGYALLALAIAIKEKEGKISN